MTTILLIRHGLTDAVGQWLAGRTPGLGLNETGKRQAARLVERLAKVPISSIYSSPLERTMETAGPLAAARSLPVHALHAVVEIDFGEWTGKTIESLRSEAAFTAWNQVRSLAPIPGGETAFDVQHRVVQALAEIQKFHDGEQVVVFSHADVIRYAVTYLTGMSVDLLWRLQIEPASITAVELGASPRLVTLNDTGQFA